MGFSHKIYQEAHQQGHKLGYQQGHKEGIKQGLDEGLRRGRLSGIAEGIRKGQLSGIAEGNKADNNNIIKHTVNALLEQGYDIKIIQKITKLKISEIKELTLV